MLIGPNNDIGLYKQLLTLGVTDYFSDDTSSDQLIVSIEQTFSDVDPAEQARVMAFIGSRGGVGSSVVAANTAYCLAHGFE
ncbi:MAG TPA: CtpF protein, partial [Alphaproteobacteria bacterium]|nr:CtpF protein [Alphaproteobacteria bacterium]